MPGKTAPNIHTYTHTHTHTQDAIYDGKETGKELGADLKTAKTSTYAHPSFTLHILLLF